MKAIVKAHPKTNEVITVATAENGQVYGKFRVEQMAFEPGKRGALNIRKRSAFITVFGQEDIDLMKSVLSEGSEYPVAGRIQRVETREPQYEGHQAKIIPADADKGTPEQEYLLDGEAVYFTDEWNGDANCSDTLLHSTESVSENVSAEAEA